MSCWSLAPLLAFRSPAGHVEKPNMARNCGQPVGADGTLQPISKKQNLSTTKELNSANNLSEPASGSFPSRASNETATLTVTLIAAL